MATIPSIIRGDVVACCRDAAVATAAGVDLLAWQDETATRVFEGVQGFMGGRNRGRLPFLEVACNDLNFDGHTADGGTVETAVAIRCHVGTRDQTTAGDLMAQILLACITKIRDRSGGVTYLTDGTEQLGPTVAGPWGLQRELQFTVRHTFSRANYGQN